MPRGVRPLAFLLLALVACTEPPVEWSDEAVTPPGDPTVDSLSASIVAPTPACVGSLRAARAGTTLYAVWWSPRADSSALLVSARSPDGGASWSPISPVDTSDRGATGCLRAPPAIAADSASGYVHITYGMTAPEGAGLFFAHSMDRGATFHSPVPILYGERLGYTSVAADGDRVVVAFEDPNSTTPRIGLALSRTMGHIFEDRLSVSNDHGLASRPIVTLKGHTIRLAWIQQTNASEPGVLRARAGTLH
ncbi:MAG: hypothetical protein ABIY52_04335 [Gemmatimonadaceae bacterium]